MLAALGAMALAAVPLLAENTHPREASGTIASVDATAHTMVVTGAKDHSQHTYLWNEKTQFAEHGKPAAAADLKAGEHVRITYLSAGGESFPTLRKVVITPAKAGKAPAEKS